MSIEVALSVRIQLTRSSIICVPAIGADARTTWVDSSDDGIGWLGLLEKKLPCANLLLYDHLDGRERKLKIADAKDPEYKSTAQAFANAEAALASYGVEDYADRVLAVINQHRQSLQV